jgi:hypothetical protein
MSQPPGGNSGDAARAGFAAGKGALLIALAVIVGIILLKQMPDDKKSAASTTTPTTKAQPKTTTTVKKPSTPTSTVPQAAVKTPAELRVIVLNGGAPAGAAGTMSTSLKQKNYTNQATASNWSGKSQKGNAVTCKPGLNREATALATTVGGASPVPVSAWPTPPPPDTDGPPPVDCVVVVGSATSGSSTSGPSGTTATTSPTT